MAKNGGKNGKKAKFVGRPSMCDKVPGETACLKQLKSGKSDVCRNCCAPAIQTIKIKVFGK